MSSRGTPDRRRTSSSRSGGKPSGKRSGPPRGRSGAPPSGRSSGRPSGSTAGGSSGKGAGSKGAGGAKGLGGRQVEGRQAVRELLIADRRKVHEIWISAELEGDAGVADIVEIAGAKRVPVLHVATA